MLEQLFGSKTRVKLLRILFRQPEKPFFVRELTRALDTQINAIRRELQLLLDVGLIQEVDGIDETSLGQGSSRLRKYYVVNQNSLLFPELHALLTKGELLGEQRFAQEMQQKGGEIQLLLLTGHFTGVKDTPSDMLIVGTVKERTIDKLISQFERECGFEIRYTTMTEKEFYDRQQIMDKFLYSLFEAKHVKVVDRLSL